MKINQPHTDSRTGHHALDRQWGARAFTMVEIMFSVLILAILLGLLIGSVRLVTGMSKNTVDRAAVHAIRDGEVQFKTLFGFHMPLVRERDADGTPATVEVVPGATPPRLRISVHSPTADPVEFFKDLQGEELGSVRTVINPLADYRFSERSIPIYLAGQFNVPLFPSQPNGVPIDGVAGPGFCKPNADGTFAVTADLIAGAAATSKRTGSIYEPLIALNSTGPKLYVDPKPSGPNRVQERVEVQDRGGVAIRYYRWEHGHDGLTDVRNLGDLNVPYMVGRDSGAIPGFNPPPDRDITTNANIKAATFAIVAAGPDGIFGDEPLDVICRKLGITYDTTQEVKIRMQAEKDNIVEVGQ